jgi:diguanylate cyclase (GGDEF)-like protein/PAS domain S-box-containing protein
MPIFHAAKEADPYMPSSEQALRESEEKFRTLAETTDCAILVWRETLLYVNPALCAITGYGPADLLHQAAWEGVIHPDDRERVRESGRARLRGESVPRHYEFRILTKGGEERWVDFTAGLIRYNGEPAVIGTAFDVTERRRAEQALRESEENLRTLAGNANDGILVHVDGRVVFANRRVSEVSGYDPAALVGMPVASLVRADQQATISQRYQSRFQGQSVPYQYETVALRQDGSEVPIEITAALSSWQGRPAIIVIVRDIASRKQAEAELFREKERLQVTLESIGGGGSNTHLAGRIEYFNPVAEELTGWTSAEAAGQPLSAVFQVRDENTRKPVADPVQRCLEERRPLRLPESVVLPHRGGHREYSVEIAASPIRNYEGAVIGAVLALHDVTTLRNMARQMAYQARHDPLTGLINRGEFEVRLEQALESARSGHTQHALCYLDLDQFKIVNDTCGHIAGDELLKQLTAHLQARVRETDTLARLGGDEFGILLEHCPIEEASETADSLRQVVKRFRFAWQGKIFEIGASIGLVPITADSGSIVDVLSAADSACYVAKDHGRNRIHVYQPEDSALTQRHGEMQWVHRVNRALGEDRFRLFFQKVMPLSADEPERYGEILVRMVDEQGKMVPPMAFIPAAERYQMMPALDRWVLSAALDALRERNPSLNEISVCAINLSGQSLCDDHFLSSVVELLDSSQVNPSHICFEITETAAIANLARATRFIAVLKGMGCRFALDDFGSGLSSFSHLKHLPVDFLKIDGSFVRDMIRDPVDAAMVEAINRIGHVMGIRTIAEAVENDAIVAKLRTLGVNFAQGSIIARPEPFQSPKAHAALGGLEVGLRS